MYVHTPCRHLRLYRTVSFRPLPVPGSNCQRRTAPDATEARTPFHVPKPSALRGQVCFTSYALRARRAARAQRAGSGDGPVGLRPTGRGTEPLAESKHVLDLEADVVPVAHRAELL